MGHPRCDYPEGRNMRIKIVLVLWLCLLSPFQQSYAQTTAANAVTSATVDTLTPEIGGIKQFIEIKTDDPDKPVLLFLSGGPGSSMLRSSENFTAILKTRFTLVQWDQRDAGQTLKLNASPVQPSVARMESDTLEVIKFIINKTGQKKIYLLGSSWGNVLGFYIVKTHPELLHAYFASNPVISQLASETALLDNLKTHFRDNPAASTELAGVKIPFRTDEDLFFLRKWLFYKEGKTNVTGKEFRDGFLQWSKVWSPVWNEVMNIDLPKTLTEVRCPVYFFVGRNDIQTSTAITQAYAAALKAPHKGLFLFEKSGHQIHQDEPEQFQKTIINILDSQGRSTMQQRRHD
jgi:pimeloyl-ACP methyl ester carboxylesterase